MYLIKPCHGPGRLTAGPGIPPESVNVGFVVENVVLGLVLSELLGFFASISSRCGSAFSYVTWGDEQYCTAYVIYRNGAPG